MTSGRPPIPVEKRFWSKVLMTGNCWLWTGSVDGRGYGQVGIQGSGQPPRIAKAHRLSWELHVGPIPDGMQLDHLCRSFSGSRIHLAQDRDARLSGVQYAAPQSGRDSGVDRRTKGLRMPATATRRLTATEAQIRSGRSMTRFRQWVASGRLPFTVDELGRRRFDAEAVDRVVEEARRYVLEPLEGASSPAGEESLSAYAMSVLAQIGTRGVPNRKMEAIQ